MPLSDSGRRAMAYWGDIQRVAAGRGTSTDLWNAIRSAAASVPGGAPLPTLAGVNEIWSRAVAIRNTGEEFAKALAVEQRTGLPQGVTDRMVTTAPWTRENVTDTAQYKIQVRFQATFVGPDGEEFPQWLTSTFAAHEMPTTVGQVIDSVASVAESNYTPAGAEFLGVDGLSLTMV